MRLCEIQSTSPDYDSIKRLDEGENGGKEQRESGGGSFFKVDCVIQSAAINHQLFNASVAEG